MMDQETISRIDQIIAFENKKNLLYTFRKDKENIASNLSIPWNGEVSKAIEVSKELISLIEVIYKEAVSEDDEYTKIQVQQALKLPEYNSYITKVSQLELVDLNFATFNEALCFYLNVYQCMYIH